MPDPQWLVDINRERATNGLGPLTELEARRLWNPQGKELELPGGAIGRVEDDLTPRVDPFRLREALYPSTPRDFHRALDPGVTRLGEAVFHRPAQSGAELMQAPLQALDVATETMAESYAQVPKLFHRPQDIEAPTALTEGPGEALRQFGERPLAEQIGLGFADPLALTTGAGLVRGAGGAQAAARRLMPWILRRTKSEVATPALTARQELARLIQDPTPGDELAKKVTLRETALDLVNLPRSLKSSMDISQPGRQSLPMVVAHPEEVWASFRQSMKARTPEGARSIDDAIRNSLDFDEIRRAAPNVYTMAGTKEAEEGYHRSRLARLIPGIGIGVRLSEDLFTSFANDIRHRLITGALRRWEAGGLHRSRAALDEDAVKFGFADTKAMRAVFRNVTPDVREHGGYHRIKPRTRPIWWSPEMTQLMEAEARRFKDLQGWAKFVQHATGRGDLGKLEGIDDLLALGLYSPRWLVAHPQMVYDVFRPGISWNVRKMILRDLSAYISFGSTVMGVAALAGARVEMDPKSSNFGQIQVGNSRVNIYGAFTTPIRYAAQLLKGERTISETGEEMRADRGGTFAKAVRSKLAPVPSLVTDLGAALGGDTARDFSGRPYEATPLGFFNQTYRQLAPLYIQDVVDMAREGSPAQAPLMLPAFFGVTVNTYEAAVQDYWSNVLKQPGQVRDLSDVEKAYVARLYAAWRRRQAEKPEKQFADRPR